MRDRWLRRVNSHQFALTGKYDVSKAIEHAASKPLSQLPESIAA